MSLLKININPFVISRPLKESIYFHTHFHARAISIRIRKALQHISLVIRKIADQIFSRNTKNTHVEIQNQKKYKWYNKIESKDLPSSIQNVNIYLGMAPQYTKFYGIDLPENTNYLSIVKQFEHDMIYRQSTLEARKISTEDVTDNQGMSIESIDEGVKLLERAILNSNSDKGIYIHCKSGVGRSATVLAAYIFKNLDSPLIEEHRINCAIQIVQNSRPDAQLINSKHSEALKKWATSKSVHLPKISF